MKSCIRALALSLSIVALTAITAFAQTGSVTGRVIDEADRSLQGATLQIQGTPLGTVTGANGEYALEDVPAGEQTIVVRFVGYRAERRVVAVEGRQEAVANFTLREDLLGMDELVVSGAFNPATKLESSTAITTLGPQQISDRVPQGTADLLRGVPGMQVTSTYGEAGADITIRGLPRTANSSFRYISLQEDGLRALEPPGLLFAFPDAYVRQDLTVERVEVVRGGSAPVFTSNTPGGIVNFITKTGGPELSGVVASSAGLHGLGRLDFNVGGPLAENWRFNVGGYYRHDEGVRDPGYPANRGGQLKLNATRDFKTGYVRFYGKHLDEENVWFMGTPFQNYKDPEPIPGGPELHTGTSYSPNRRVVTIPDAFNPGSTTQKRMDEGFDVRYNMVGGELLKDMGKGWNVNLRSRLINTTNDMNLMIDVADPFPITAFMQPSIPAEVPRFGLLVVSEQRRAVCSFAGGCQKEHRPA